MTKDNGCAGSYSVSGYTRSDGTEVSGYTRTCGAAHNSSSSSSSSKSSSNPQLDDEEKIKQRAELLYPTMKEKENNYVEKSDFEYIMPTESGYISSYYGKRKSPGEGASTFHSGIDIAVPVGTPIKAIADGKVRVANGGIKGYGNAVYINHGMKNGKRIESEYGHVSKFLVRIGENVKQGQIIALSGGAKGSPGSGVSQGPHLHLTIREYENNQSKGNSIDPIIYIKNSKN